jgi:hypothetical protein
LVNFVTTAVFFWEKQSSARRRLKKRRTAKSAGGRTTSHGAPERCSAKGRGRQPPPQHLPSDHATAEPGPEAAVRYTWTMPKIFEQDGYSFFFYSNGHAPIHVHVRRGGGEAVFVVEPEVELRESVGFNVRELS